MEALRGDLVFSYWIYVWYLLYIFKFIKYSPKLALIIGLIYNIIMLLMMLLYGTSSRTIFYFIIINTFIKVIPLYYLRNETIKINNIYFIFSLFLVFIIWLQINKKNLVGNIKLIHDSLLYGKDKTPFIAFINKLKSNFKVLKVL